MFAGKLYGCTSLGGRVVDADVVMLDACKNRHDCSLLDVWFEVGFLELVPYVMMFLKCIIYFRLISRANGLFLNLFW